MATRNSGWIDAFRKVPAAVGMTNETNRPANGLRPPVDPQLPPKD